ncbi:SGNH/GDSL hydrolase family protein [Ereboglobus luteus]|uniref:GDSL family lipase n=1 Tax=Ereboglobus luteus TaxID=1796921 RepID=A0A2U8E0N3_9BACT|nr:SGNH/GDSL hydrolase family protein [Ereboglobus luteus]AWI08142.1 GDSL family lipase [Ereboglobus luteus]
MTTIGPKETILFYGDSITDCGRDRGNVESLGSGYPGLIGVALACKMPSQGLRFINTGVSGDRIYDLEKRMEADLVAHAPSIVTFLIGINDTWRRFDSNIVSPAGDFQAAYKRILRAITNGRTMPAPRIVLMEPFVLPVPEDRRQWRADLDPRIHAVRELAVEFGADLIPLDGLFAAAATRAPAAYWLPDGVHPSAAGHALIADAWMANVRIASANP